MKKTVLALAALAFFSISKAQTVSTFEGLTLATDSFWDGRANTAAKGFADGHAFFTNDYDTSFGGFWASGFAYTNKKDSTNGTYTNLYSAITASGYNASSNYLVGQQDAVVRLTGNAMGRVVEGVYITNATYPYKSIKNGDSFAKKFGGITGNDPDFFVMNFLAWHNGVKKQDTVKFYLADFRSSNNTQDYIVNSWTWLDLSSFGNVDSIQIHLNSSDTGAFGINTPLFYALDNFTTRDEFATGIAVPENPFTLQAYPNPFGNTLTCRNTSNSEIYLHIVSVSGARVSEIKLGAKEYYVLNTDEWAKGIYFVQVISGSTIQTKKLIKN